MSIFDILSCRYDFNNEFKKISLLFHEKNVKYSYAIDHFRAKTDYFCMEDIVTDYFSSWVSRGTCISCQNMRDELGIDSILSESKKNEEKIILCMEYYENIINLFLNLGEKLSKYKIDIDKIVMLRKNMDALLEHLHYEKHIFNEQEKVILVPKNPAATAVAKISSEDTAIAILQYHHASLKGQLAEKKDVLRRIAQEYEPLLDKPIDGYTEYFKTANNMLNNLDIRHNNKAGKKKNALVTSLTNEELENWYDELYQLLLFCVLIKDNKDRKDKIAEFLKGLQENKS